jgi:hypothetical protein
MLIVGGNVGGGGCELKYVGVAGMLAEQDGSHVPCILIVTAIPPMPYDPTNINPNHCHTTPSTLILEVRCSLMYACARAREFAGCQA